MACCLIKMRGNSLSGSVNLFNGVNVIITLTLPDKLFPRILIKQQATNPSVISLKGTMTASDYRTKVSSFNCFSEAVVAKHR